MSKGKPRYVTVAPNFTRPVSELDDSGYLIGWDKCLRTDIEARVQRAMERSLNPPLFMPARIDPPRYSFTFGTGTVHYIEERGPNGTPRALWMD